MNWKECWNKLKQCTITIRGVAKRQIKYLKVREMKKYISTNFIISSEIHIKSLIILMLSSLFFWTNQGNDILKKVKKHKTLL